MGTASTECLEAKVPPGPYSLPRYGRWCEVSVFVRYVQLANGISQRMPGWGLYFAKVELGNEGSGSPGHQILCE